MQNARHLAVAVAIYAIASLANTAGAAAAFCPDDIGNEPSIEDNVGPNVGCQIGTTSDDSLGSNPDNYQVNQDMLFGFDDWVFAERAFDDHQDIDIGLSLVGDTISGLWSIDDIWNTVGASSLMLVFTDSDDDSSSDSESHSRSGDDDSSDDDSSDDSGEPDHYVAYLITPDNFSGDYLTPFISAASGNPSDILHVSAYFRSGVVQPTSQPIPEPGSIALLGLGILVMGLRRRKSTNS